MPTLAACDAREAEYGGFHAVELSNGLLRAALTPDIGGRVLQLWLGDHPFFFVNQRLAGRLFTPDEHRGDGTMASWKTYGGSKTWPAPQGWDGPGQWPGPPDPLLDGGPFRTVAISVGERASSVLVESPPDPWTGLIIRRDLVVHVDAARATLRREMHNASDRPVRWSLWEVVQLDCGRLDADGQLQPRRDCRAYVPVNPRSRYRHPTIKSLRVGSEVTYGDPNNPQWQMRVPGLFEARYQGQLGKVSLDSSAGWAAFADGDGDWVFAQRFSYHPGQEYPDNGASVEIWSQGPGMAAGVDFSQPDWLMYFLELEVLGPLVTLRPGERASMDLEWLACRCPAPILDVTDVGCVGRRLAVERQGERARLSGAYGVFRPGTLRLTALDAAERPLATLADQPASPLEPALLDLAASLPPAAAALELRLADAAGADLGRLDRVALERGA